MRLDVDEVTAVMGITVLTHMLSLDLLEAEECMEVCELIFMEARAISHAAGQFAVNYLFSADFMDRARQKPGSAGQASPQSAGFDPICFFFQARRSLVRVRFS